MLGVKYCGITTATARDAVLQAGGLYMGCVFYPPSPRHIAPQQAGALCAPVRGRVQSVAVSVNADDALLDAIMQHMQPDYIQCHGDEPIERLAAIKTRYQCGIIKAFRLRERADLAPITAYADVADMLLYDAKPANATLPGGTGHAFDWQLLNGHHQPRPWLLSGGLRLENITEAALQTGCTLIDISSGIEDAPGVKSVAKILACGALCQTL